MIDGSTIDRLIPKVRQDGISEILFYLRNGLQYEEHEILCMMVYHLVARLPKKCDCEIKKYDLKQCDLDCFARKAKVLFPEVGTVTATPNGKMLHVCGKNAEYELEWHSSVYNRRTSFFMIMPGCGRSRITYDEYLVTPDEMAAVDSSIPRLKEMVKDVILTANRSAMLSKIKEANKSEENGAEG